MSFILSLYIARVQCPRGKHGGKLFSNAIYEFIEMHFIRCTVGAVI